MLFLVFCMAKNDVENSKDKGHNRENTCLVTVNLCSRLVVQSM